MRMQVWMIVRLRIWWRSEIRIESWLVGFGQLIEISLRFVLGYWMLRISLWGSAFGLLSDSRLFCRWSGLNVEAYIVWVNWIIGEMFEAIEMLWRIWIVVNENMWRVHNIFPQPKRKRMRKIWDYSWFLSSPKYDAKMVDMIIFASHDVKINKYII